MNRDIRGRFAKKDDERSKAKELLQKSFEEYRDSKAREREKLALIRQRRVHELFYGEEK